MPAGRGSTCPPRPVPCRQVVAGGGSSSTPKDARSRCRRESASISAASPRAWRWTPRSSACGRWASGRRWSAPGDLRVHGLPPGGDGWPIAIEGPRTAVTIALTHGSLATSGIGRHRWRQGEVERHHLLDPRHARPAQTGLWSVTVAAATCAQAEVAAKTAFILGPRAGTDFLERRRLAGGLGRPGEGLVVASLSMTWVATRAAGYTAFALLTASVALGLLLSSPL